MRWGLFSASVCVCGWVDGWVDRGKKKKGSNGVETREQSPPRQQGNNQHQDTILILHHLGIQHGGRVSATVGPVHPYVAPDGHVPPSSTVIHSVPRCVLAMDGAEWLGRVQPPIIIATEHASPCVGPRHAECGGSPPVIDTATTTRWWSRG